MDRFSSAALTPMRVVRSALQQVARVIVVLSLIFAFDFIVPDKSRTISQSDAAASTITYNYQDGSANGSVSWTPGTAITLPNPSRAGYTFKGWSDRPNGSDLVYQTTRPYRDAPTNRAIVYTTGYGLGAGNAVADLANPAAFNRVRYIMQANYNGTPYYADVAFDKWQQNLSLESLAIPDLNNPFVVHTNVNNLSIDSNWTGVGGVADAVTEGWGKTGRLEIWPWNYGVERNTALSLDGSDSLFDYNDSNVGNTSGSIYGSFQVHNMTDLEPVFVWNRHFESTPDIGFGKFRGVGPAPNYSSHPDWTFVRQSNFDVSQSPSTWSLKIYIGDTIPGGRSYTPSNSSGFTLYAQWEANTYTVTYNYNNATGGNSTSSSSFTTGGAPITLPTPTRSGHVFGGWYSDSNFTTSIGAAGASYSPTSSVTAYAKWSKQLTVTYNSQLGSAISSGTVLEGASIVSSPGTPTRAGYDFKGWFASSTGGTAITFPYAHGQSSNFTLYAQWITNQSGFAITGAPSTLGYQDMVTLSTSGGNGGGAVVFATTSPSICSVNANTRVVTMLVSSGTCSIAATKAADDDYYATSASVTIEAAKASQASLSIVGDSSESYGGTINLSTSGGSTNGNVTWSAGSSTACTVTSVGVVTVTAGSGTCSVTATMAGNGNYNAVTSSTHAVTVSKANQATLTVTTTEVAYGRTLTLATSGGSGSGAVTWTRVSGTCQLNSGVIDPVGAGSLCVVRATKAGDANFNSKVSADTTIDVVKASQTGFSITSDSSFTTGSSLALSASGGQSSGGITWSATPSQCVISGTSLTSSRGGVTCVVTATRAGDSNYLSVSDSLNITVAKISQTLTFRSSAPSPGIVGNTYTVSVDSNVFLAPTIVVSNQSQSVCSISAGVVTFVTPGTCIVSASQSGTDVYSSAAASQSITVVAATANSAQSSSDIASATTNPATGTVAPRAAASSPTTTAPRASGSGATTTTSSTTTTTTTTTTVALDPSVPQTNPDGSTPRLSAGATTAVVRGKVVKVDIEQVDESLVLTLPNDVKVKIGRVQPGGESVSVAADGVLRMYRKDSVDIQIAGLVPGSTFTIFMFSEPVELGRGIVSPDGSVTLTVRVPDGVEYGDHTVQVNGVGPDNEVVSMSMGFEVIARDSNTLVVVISMMGAILLALLGGRPIFVRRKKHLARR